MRKFLAEFIGTFFLLFTVSVTVIRAAPLAPLAIGSVLMVMIYAGGHVSGGHFNPAVTLAVLIRGRIAVPDAAGYVFAQVSGGVVGALAGYWVTNPASVTALELSGRSMSAAFVAEAVFTFALAYVVLNVATSRSHPNNSFYGLAIGFTVLTGAVAVGGVSGGAFNPAVALGAATIGILSWSSIWIHLIAEALGGAIAAVAFLTVSEETRAVPTPPPSSPGRQTLSETAGTTENHPVQA